MPFSILKVFILRIFGASIGKGCVIKPGVSIKYPWFFSIGNHVWLGENVWIDNLTFVEIADNCCLSQGAMLLTGNHNYKKTTFDLKVGKIILEEGVWIGAKALVCPGVNAGRLAVLTAGSVLTTNMEASTIYQGNPAKAKKRRIIS